MIDVRQRVARRAHRDGGEEIDGSALARGQLLERAIPRARFAQNSISERRDLVRADDNGVLVTDITGLGHRETQRPGGRLLRGDHLLVRARSRRLERQAETLEQLPPEHGCRRQNESLHGRIFDSRQDQNYDSPIMPARLRAWYTAAEIETLAARQARFRGEFTVKEMRRLAAHLGSEHGSATAEFAFSSRAPGYVSLALEIESGLGATCQRCLEPFELEISERVEFGVVVDESSIGLLPEGIEPLVLDGDRLMPLQLVEDELIMAVPMVPKHVSERCALDTAALPDGVTVDGDAERVV